MCGIFAVINDEKKQAAETVLEGLKKLEYRGYDSWGVAVKPSKSDKIKLEKHVGKIGEARVSLPASSMAIGHTRWATHGGVTDENAHPHLDGSGKVAVVHNGIVENYQELKSQLKKKKHHFQSETDTEVIAHLIEEKKKTLDVVKAVFESFNIIAGSNAIVIFDIESKQIIACRDGSPLIVGVGQDRYYLASDVTALLKHTNRVIYLKDREGIVLSETGIKLYSLDSGKEKKLRIEQIDWDEETAEKGNFPHFLIKEIFEQKETIPRTALINKEEILSIAKQIKKNKKVILLACGTAYHCCLLSTYYFAQVGVEALAFHAHEFESFAQFCDKNTLVIAISQSGETADTLIASRRAKEKGAKLLAVINARGSTLERLADYVLSVGAGPEIAVVSTKAFTAQLATIYLLSQAVAGQYPAAQKRLKKVGQDLKKWLTEELEKKVIKLAKTLLDEDHIYVIGKKENYAGALEFALKIKESSYLHAEAFAASELKHGVISLVKNGTPCFALASNDHLKAELLSSVTELKARGARTIGISSFKATEFDKLIKTPDWQELTVIANVIVGQLLAYFLAIGLGADPDKPRNLAKSVTVK
ncbi:MAG: glutamine--fructose-6-phosphate transaminase (isomerizing) [Candidatus Woesebacteria bacterium]|jgi:glucosamine--fructose-6-phosphate aminotransferase (isomerizing)